MANQKITREDLAKVVRCKSHLHLAMMKVSNQNTLITSLEWLGLPCAFECDVLDELPEERKSRLLCYSNVRADRKRKEVFQLSTQRHLD